MNNRDVEIHPTVSFRHPNIPDQVIGEHKPGFHKLEVQPARTEDVSAVLPPAPTREPPQTSIASRLRDKFEKRSK